MVRGQPRIRAFAAPLPHTLAALRRVPASRLMTPPVRRALNSPSGLESTTSRRLNHACRQPQVQGIGLARMFLLPTLSRTFVATPSRTHRSVHGVLWTGGTALLGVSCIFFAFSHFYFASSPYGTPLYNFIMTGTGPIHDRCITDTSRYMRIHANTCEYQILYIYIYYNHDQRESSSERLFSLCYFLL